MSEALRWWLNNPREWNAHPYTVLWGYLAGAVVTVVLAVVFWIKGKRNP
jgi:hypothetical protein